MSSLYEKIGSAPEQDKMTAICNYVMEKANHEILYSETRERSLDFNADNWSSTAEEEKRNIFVYVNNRYADEKEAEGKAEYKTNHFLGSFGNCDHYSHNVIDTLNSINLDQRYDFGQIFCNADYDMGHALCYFHDTVTNKIMMIDPWMNVYYDLKNYEYFLNGYLNKYFSVTMTSHRSDSDSVIGDVVGFEIRNGTKYNGDVFYEHLKSHYKRT